MPKQRAQRKTLTYAQMYGSGMQEGAGIFSKIKKWLKKTKVISRLASLGAPLVGILPVPGAGAASAALGIAGQFAAQRGFGKVKNITCRQVEALKMGLGCPLKGGGVSLAGGRKIFPGIKNITPTQMRALAAFRGRHMKGRGISLAGGRASGLTGLGFSGMGVKLAGQGLHGGQKKKIPRRTRIFI